MRVGRARHRPSCLEDLHPRVVLGEFRLLRTPQFDHAADLGGRHGGERQVVPWREADHPTLTHRCVGGEPSVVAVRRHRCIREQCSEVVGEHERGVVVRVADPAGTLVARTEVAVGVVRGRSRRRLAGGAVPWSLGPLRRHDHPVARQRVATSVGVDRRIERHAATVDPTGPLNRSSRANNARPAAIVGAVRPPTRTSGGTPRW